MKMLPFAESLSCHRVLRSSDINVARDIVSQKFGAHLLRAKGGRYQFEARYNHVSGKRLSMNYLSYGCEVSIEPGELKHFYQVQFPQKGKVAIRRGDSLVHTRVNTAAILNPIRKTQMVWGEGCEQLLLHIKKDALHDAAEKILGCHLPQPVLFKMRMPLSHPTVQKWINAFREVCRVAEHRQAFGSIDVRYQDQLESKLVAGLILSQDSSISYLLKQFSDSGETSKVRRAKRFILKNLAEQVTVSEVAQAACCSVRTIQDAFKNELNCSPIQFLEAARIKYAHYLLCGASHGTLVQDVAFDTGFSNPGRFSIAYRKAFGRSPGAMLAEQLDS